MTKDRMDTGCSRTLPSGSERQRAPRDSNVPQHVTRPVSRKSEAIIKEVSARRRTAMKVLANR